MAMGGNPISVNLIYAYRETAKSVALIGSPTRRVGKRIDDATPVTKSLCKRKCRNDCGLELVEHE